MEPLRFYQIRTQSEEAESELELAIHRTILGQQLQGDASPEQGQPFEAIYQHWKQVTPKKTHIFLDDEPGINQLDLVVSANSGSMRYLNEQLLKIEGIAVTSSYEARKATLTCHAGTEQKDKIRSYSETLEEVAKQYGQETSAVVKTWDSSSADENLHNCSFTMTGNPREMINAKKKVALIARAHDIPTYSDSMEFE